MGKTHGIMREDEAAKYIKDPHRNLMILYRDTYAVYSGYDTRYDTPDMKDFCDKIMKICALSLSKEEIKDIEDLVDKTFE